MARYGMSFVKCLICVFSLLFLTMGLILIILGSFAVNEIRRFDLVKSELSVFVPALVICTGSLISLAAFVGCVGAVRESYWLTVTYSLLLFVILILEIVSSVSAYVFIDTVGKVVENRINSSISVAAQGNNSAGHSWDQMQKTLRCCGVRDYLDWTPVAPPSCCPELSANQLQCPQERVFKEGCLDKLQAIFIKQGLLIAVLLVIFLFLQMIGIVSACCLANVMNKEYDVT